MERVRRHENSRAPRLKNYSHDHQHTVYNKLSCSLTRITQSYSSLGAKCPYEAPRSNTIPIPESIHSFMTYRLNPFSISENLGVNKSTSEHMCLNGAHEHKTDVQSMERTSPPCKRREIRTVIKDVLRRRLPLKGNNCEERKSDGLLYFTYSLPLSKNSVTANWAFWNVWDNV